MAQALWHRGPDDDGSLLRPGFGFANRRLSIVGLGDGQQPIFNEDRTVAVVFNGELFDYPERKAELQAKGHVFRTHTDTEIIVHLYEEYGEASSSSCAASSPSRSSTSTSAPSSSPATASASARCTGRRQGDWLFFGSEIKALLASGSVPARADPRGLDHLFTFFAMGTRRTMFEGVQSMLPGHYLKIAFRRDGSRPRSSSASTGTSTSPTPASEDNPADDQGADRRVRGRLPPGRRDPAARRRAGGRLPLRRRRLRLRAGHGLASCAARRCPSFTIQVPGKGLDETERRVVDGPRHRQPPDHPALRQLDVIADTYPQLIARGRLPGARHLVRRAVAPVAGGARARATRSR